MRTCKLQTGLLVLLVSLLASPAGAREHHQGGGGFYGGFGGYGNYGGYGGYGYPYGVGIGINAYPTSPYPYGYYGGYPNTGAYPYTGEPAVTYIQQPPPAVAPVIPAYPGSAQTSQPPVAQNWYYCRETKAYYPNVTSCARGWEQVPATPPAP